MANLDNPSGTIGDGRTIVVTAGTPVKLSTVSVPCFQVAITAETDNTGIIVIGGATVVAAIATRRGHPLGAGGSLVLPIVNLDLLWLDSTVSGDGVTYMTLF